MRRLMFVLAAVTCATSGLAVRAQQQPTVVWAPKPIQLPAYSGPLRPHIKLAELKARHCGEQNWRELLVDDGHLQAEYIASAPGATVSKRLHPDSRAWWVVVDGQIRVEIEGQPSFVATKGSLVQVPKQTIYSMETIGDRPSLRFAVNVADAKTLYPQDVQPPSIAGFKFVPIPLNRNPAPYENGNRPHTNLYEAAKAAAKYTGGPFVRDDKVNATIIYGYEKDLPPLDPKDRGHFHPDSPEFWLVMSGQIEYLFENRDAFVADEGDVAYVPPSTYHRARFHGPGPSCRLAIVRFPNNTALIER